MISKTSRVFAAAAFIGGYLATSVAALAATTDFSYTGAIESWTADYSGDYRITAIGAQGASAESDYDGGRGAEIRGTFTFTAGDMFQVLVGGAGTAGVYNGGGGGGTFFVSVADAPLLIAGGGGGARLDAGQNGTDASITEAAYFASGGASTYTPTLSGRAAGTGGIVSSSSWGSGGAGFLGDGADDGSWGTGGVAWASGMLGGNSTGCGADGSSPAVGGFGGGGGGGCGGGGGGGGYTGGDGGWIGGGGGSLNTGLDIFALAGVGYGNGSLSIEFLGDVPAVPLPAGLPLLLAGLGAFGLVSRRRKG